MLRHFLPLFLVLLAGPLPAGAGDIKPADVRLLEGAEPFVAAFLARPGLRYEPRPARLDRHGRRLAHVFSGPLWLQRELVARGLAVVAPPLVSRERALALLALGVRTGAPLRARRLAAAGGAGAVAGRTGRARRSSTVSPS